MPRDAGTACEGPPKCRSGILVIEDEALLASAIRDVLEASGFSVALASSGAEALSLAFANPPALALIDIRLAGPMNGIEVARTLRARLGVKPIFLSGAAEPDILACARQVPSAAFLRKPFRPSQVFNAIARVLGSGSALR
jgi:CheY-like chemotaxis protein